MDKGFYCMYLISLLLCGYALYVRVCDVRVGVCDGCSVCKFKLYINTRFIS